MKKVLFLAVLTFSVMMVSAQSLYEYNVHYSYGGDSLLYRSLKPEKIERGKRYPLVIYLHNAGLKGSDNVTQLREGSEMFLNPVNRERYPSFVIFPQCPKGEWWAYDRMPRNFDALPYTREMTRPMAIVKEIIDKYLAMPEVDKGRVYVMGTSMGGVGTFDIVSRFPEIFAAAVPMCGAIAEDHLSNAQGVSFRIFHGDSDPTVPVECSRRAYRELRAAGVKVEYIELPGAKHGISSQTLSRPDFMEWLYAQKRGKRSAKIK